MAQDATISGLKGLACAVFITALVSCTSPPPSNVELAPKFDIQVTVRSIRKPTIPPRIGFRVSSGQINIGCGEGRHTSVDWRLPAGATDVQPRVSWQHTDNLKGQVQSFSIANGVVTAQGDIVGLDKQMFNCPGGGHGELILEGDYQPEAPSQADTQLLKSVHDQVAVGQQLLVSLPVDAAAMPTFCDVVISYKQQSSHATIKFTTDAQGKLTILEISPNSTPPLQATLRDNILAVSVPHA
jgi:hypothetical protein